MPDFDLTRVAPGEDDATVAATAGAARPEPVPATLERSDEPGFVVPLPGELLVIGRSSTADIRVDDSRVSRSHLSLERAGSRWTATDQGSSNGSWVNGQQLSSNMPRLLRDGDELRIGPVTFTFRSGDASLPDRASPPEAATRVLGDDGRYGR
jgi:pSer/pThr/pTyr-binding forkhead associated (FHA) protein